MFAIIYIAFDKRHGVDRAGPELTTGSDRRFRRVVDAKRMAVARRRLALCA